MWNKITKKPHRFAHWRTSNVSEEVKRTLVKDRFKRQRMSFTKRHRVLAKEHENIVPVCP